MTRAVNLIKTTFGNILDNTPEKKKYCTTLEGASSKISKIINEAAVATTKPLYPTQRTGFG